MNKLDGEIWSTLGSGCLVMFLVISMWASVFIGACFIVKWIFF